MLNAVVTLLAVVYGRFAGYTYFLRMVLSGVKKFESVQILRLSLTPLSAANGRDDVTPTASDVAVPTTPTSAAQKESVSVETKRAQFVMTSSKQAAVKAGGKRSGW